MVLHTVLLLAEPKVGNAEPLVELPFELCRELRFAGLSLLEVEAVEGLKIIYGRLAISGSEQLDGQLLAHCGFVSEAKIVAQQRLIISGTLGLFRGIEYPIGLAVNLLQQRFHDPGTFSLKNLTVKRDGRWGDPGRLTRHGLCVPAADRERKAKNRQDGEAG